MTDTPIFDSQYAGETQATPSISVKSATKSFIKEPISTDTFAKYGTSKPRRVVIKAKIKNG